MKKIILRMEFIICIILCITMISPMLIEPIASVHAEGQGDNNIVENMSETAESTSETTESISETTESSSETTETTETNESEPVNESDVTETTIETEETISPENTGLSLQKPMLFAFPRSAGAVSEITDNMVDSVAITLVTNTDTEMTDDVSMTLGTKYIIKLKMKNPLYFAADETEKPLAGPSDKFYVIKEKKYTLTTIPNQLKLPTGTSIEWPAQAQGVTFGTAKAEADGDGALVVSLTINSDFAQSYLDNAYVGVTVQFNEDKLGGLEEQALTFSNPATTINANVTDYAKKNPIMEKNGVYSDGEITWTVGITNDSNPVIYGTDGKPALVFKDSFSDNQEYVEGSFKIGTGHNDDVEPSDASINLSVDADGLAYTYDAASFKTANPIFANKDLNEPGGVTFFTYKTRPTEAAFKSLLTEKMVNGGTYYLASKDGSDMTFTNQAGLYEAGMTTPVCQKNATVTENVKLYSFQKEATNVDSSNGTITWQITVDTNGFYFKNVKIYDKMADAPKMNFLSSTVSANINAIPVLAPVVTENVENSSGTTAQGNAYSWYYDIGDLNGQYIITYQTQIDNYEQYLQTNQKKPSNTAWMEFDWQYKGAGDNATITNIGVPGFSQSADAISNSVISKKCTGYDPVTHQFTWEVTVNENKIALTNVKVRELVQPGQNLVKKADGSYDISIPSANGISLGDTYWTDHVPVDIPSTEGEGIDLTLGNDANKTTVKFIIKTELELDPSKSDNQWTAISDNKKDDAAHTYTNKAELYNDGSKVDTATA
ncbi:MAG: hypothetical protein PHP50_06725 [Lachnospiraceae bacterium]|nr:hypothetical protein [Lachnospiraceae bacterium]